MTTPSIRRVQQQLASVADLPAVSAVVPVLGAPFARRHRRPRPWAWRPSTPQLAIAMAVAVGLGAILRRRRRSAAADLRDTAGSDASNGNGNGNGAPAVPTEDRSGTWADDGGAAPGRPGDDPTRLSSSPTETTRRYAGR